MRGWIQNNSVKVSAALTLLVIVLVTFNLFTLAMNGQKLDTIDKLNQTNSELQERNSNLSQTASNLEQRVQRWSDYSIAHNLSKARKISDSPENYRTAYRSMQNATVYMEIGRTAINEGDRYYTEQNYYSEAAASYYLASIYFESAKQDLIEARSNIENQESKDNLRTIIKTLDNLVTLSETYERYMYALYNGEQQEADSLESEISDLKDELDDQSLEMELMEWNVE